MIHNTKLLLLLVVVLLSGCSWFKSQETLEQKLITFEKNYGDILKQVNEWIVASRFTDADKAFLEEQVRIISQARKALYKAKEIDDINGMIVNLNAAKDALTKIRDYIKQKVEILAQPLTLRLAIPLRAAT